MGLEEEPGAPTQLSMCLWCKACPKGGGKWGFSPVPLEQSGQPWGGEFGLTSGASSTGLPCPWLWPTLLPSFCWAEAPPLANTPDWEVSRGSTEEPKCTPTGLVSFGVSRLRHAQLLRGWPWVAVASVASWRWHVHVWPQVHQQAAGYLCQQDRRSHAAQGCPGAKQAALCYRGKDL